MKKCLNHILNIIITFIILLIVTSIILLSTIFNKKYILNTLNKTNYYNETYQIAKKHYDGVIIQLRIENNTLSNIFTKKDIKKDIKGIITSIYNNKEYTINKKNIENKLDTSINKLIKENNITLTKEEQKEINELKRIIINNYETDILYSNKIINKIKKYYPKINSLLKILTIVLFISIIILNILNKKIQKRIIYIPFLSSGIIFIIIKVLINSKYRNILLLTKPFTKTLKYIINSISNIYLVIGIIFVIASIINTYYSKVKNTVK